MVLCGARKWIKIKHAIPMMIISLLVLNSSLAFSKGNRNELTLRIQPIQSVKFMKKAYKPLAEYLSNYLGYSIKIVVADNFLIHWHAIRQSEDSDIVLDAAHFTGFRVKRHRYDVLAKIIGTVTYSLISKESVLFFDSRELVGKRVATVPSPSLGGIRLLQLFPYLARQPIFVVKKNYTDVLDLVRKGSVEAGIVPTALINNDLTVNTVVATQPVPHMAISVAPNMKPSIMKRIKNVLINATKSKEGRDMLSKLNIEGFTPSNIKEYIKYETLLKDVWGY